MSSATETINKLSEALNTLITAYEALQQENNGLNDTIKQLKDEKSKLENDKTKMEQENNNLHENVTALSDNSEQQNNSMYNMLDKIEILLGNEVAKNESSPPLRQDEPSIVDHNETQSLIEDEATALATEDLEPSTESSSDEKDNKIDLNRMASLLNGFNK